MIKLGKSNKSYCAFAVVVLLIFSLSASHNGTSLPKYESNILKTLPGFSGDLPFKLETGYIGMGREEEVQLFYYFVESERDPRNDPLLVWLTVGPGCSALFGLTVENVGPLTFNYTGLIFNYTTSSWESDLPSLLLNPYPWTKVASIIFLDQPVATGFSYGTTARSNYTNDGITSRQSYEFLKKWLTMKHPELIEVPLFIGGSSYTGKIVPFITKKIVEGNEAEDGFKMNLKGYVLGNPYTDADIDRNEEIKFIHRVSIISDEIYELTMRSCKGEKRFEDSTKPECRKNLNVVYECKAPLGEQHVLETKCNSSINQGCPENNYLLGDKWANNPQVRRALHIREGTVKHWEMCSDSRKFSYSTPAKYASSVQYHQYLSKKSINALIFSGDQDPGVPYVATQQWIKKLNVSIAEAWRPWFVNDQVAGFVTKHSNGHYNLTFTTIKGGSHVAVESNPRECFAMFQRWLEQNSL